MLTELNVYGLWGGVQASRGVAATSLPKRLRQVAGDVGFTRDDGSENYSDLDGSFTDATDWVNRLAAAGTPGIEGTPEETAWVLWWLHGGETTTPVVGPPAKTRHQFVPLPGLGFWASIQKRLGVTNAVRRLYQDCQASQVQIEGSTGTKPIRITPTILGLDPEINKVADPPAAMSAKEPFLYTDGTGRFTIDGVAFSGQSQFTLVINRDYQPVDGDDNVIYDLATGNAVVTIGVTVALDANALAEFNTLVYGAAAPAADAKPRRGLSPLGSYAYDLKAKDPTTGALNGDRFDAVIPGIKWTVPDFPGPNPDGGAGELALAGAMRKVAGQPAYTLGVECDAAAFTGAG